MEYAVFTVFETARKFCSPIDQTTMVPGGMCGISSRKLAYCVGNQCAQ